MAYSEISTASATLSREMTATRNLLGKIGAAFSGAMIYLAETSALNARAQQAMALYEKSDEELAAMNLKREDIVRHVFGAGYFV